MDLKWDIMGISWKIQTTIFDLGVSENSGGPQFGPFRKGTSNDNPWILGVAYVQVILCQATKQLQHAFWICIYIYIHTYVYTYVNIMPKFYRVGTRRLLNVGFNLSLKAATSTAAWSMARSGHGLLRTKPKNFIELYWHDPGVGKCPFRVFVSHHLPISVGYEISPIVGSCETLGHLPTPVGCNFN